MAGDVGSLTPDNINYYNFYTQQGDNTKLLFHYASLAQAEREQEFTTGRWSEGGCADKREYELWSTYWCFYRAGVRPNILSSSYHYGVNLSCGWIPVDGGCHSRRYESGRSIIGIGVGGGGTSSGGAWPYSNETLNLNPSLLLITNSELYD